MSKKTTAWYAHRYVSAFGFGLVPIEPGRKFPRSKDWGNTCLTTPEAAQTFYNDHPDWNIGLALGPSSMCSLDIDCTESFRTICEVFGIDLDDLIASTPTIQGASKGMRLEFRVPAGVQLPYRKMSWPARNDPTGDKHRAAMRAAQAAKEAGDTERERRIRRVARRWASFCVFELRSSCDGRQRQDVLPPSIHPDTGKPYRWVTQPAKNWPEPPPWLLAIWQDYDKFKPQFAACCPWVEVPEIPKSKVKPKPVSSGDSVITAFVQAHDLRSVLDNYGYTKRGRRWLSPHSSTGLPGVVIFPDGLRCWIHHASDPLCSETRGNPVNAFDLYTYYEHGGDLREAVKAAADALGMSNRQQQATYTEPSTAAHVAAQGESQHVVEKPSRDTMSPLPWATEKGKPLQHIDNLREICRRLGVVIRYNLIKKDEEILIPGQAFTVDNRANASLAWLQSECSLFDFQTGKLGDFVTYLADQNTYNPVAKWVESTPWDGVSRVSDFYATVTAKGEDSDPSIQSLKETLIKRWMISAIAAAYSPTGISAAGVLVFQGGQYLGKTKWFKSLVPQELDLVKDGMLLRPDNKDSVKQIVSYWLVELGELDSTFRKADIAALKAFITKDSDELRLAYARKESQFARRTVFFGSVNPREFLNDNTGNRRYWTVECEHIDHSHTLDMQQVWAEFLAMWRGGEGCYLTPDEMQLLNAHNESFQAIEPVEERLLAKLDWDAPSSLWRWEQASVVLNEVGFDHPTKQDAMAAAQLIRKNNEGQHKRSNGRSLLLCPPLVHRGGY